MKTSHLVNAQPKNKSSVAGRWKCKIAEVLKPGLGQGLTWMARQFSIKQFPADEAVFGGRLS